jgi:hypothetical protein
LAQRIGEEEESFRGKALAENALVYFHVGKTKKAISHLLFFTYITIMKREHCIHEEWLCLFTFGFARGSIVFS